MGVELTARIVRGGQLLYALCNPVASFLPSRQPHNASQTRMASTLIKTSAAPPLASPRPSPESQGQLRGPTNKHRRRVRGQNEFARGRRWTRAWALAPLTIESVNNVNRSGVLTALEASLGNEQVIITTITSIEPVYMRRLLSVSSPRSTCHTGRLPSALMAMYPLLALNATVTNGLFELERPLGTPCHALASRPTVWGVRCRLAPSRPAQS